MKPVAKAGLVAIGYVAALAVALLVVGMYVARTSGPDRQSYGAMFAFGDSLLFLAASDWQPSPRQALRSSSLDPAPHSG